VNCAYLKSNYMCAFVKMCVQVHFSFRLISFI